MTKLLNCFTPQFPHLKNGNKSTFQDWGVLNGSSSQSFGTRHNARPGLQAGTDSTPKAHQPQARVHPAKPPLHSPPAFHNPEMTQRVYWETRRMRPDEDFISLVCYSSSFYNLIPGGKLEEGYFNVSQGFGTSLEKTRFSSWSMPESPFISRQNEDCSS
ncbi:uncharacterized protein RHO17_006273 [Thomomys bottae]